MYNEKRVRNSELLQLLLLNCLYALSGSEQIIFQGGTALRWIYGGMRFSEDLDFVTHLDKVEIDKILKKVFQKAHNVCIAQFGSGQSEQMQKQGRKEATKVFFIFRPQGQRERIAVKLEFEKLMQDRTPDFKKIVLRDTPVVSGMITGGKLVMPYSSSIILAETPQEILSDKIRALYERRYLKGRDIYDLWWITEQLKASPSWEKTRDKLTMYQGKFIPARELNYFQNKESINNIINAIETDLPRFIPRNIYDVYKEDNFQSFTSTLKKVTSELMNQGMDEYFKEYERR